MSYTLDSAAERRLEAYFGQIGAVLRRPEQRASYAMYAVGLLGEGARKSVEPIAARLCPDPEQVDAVHQRLLHFVGPAPWSDEQVRLTAARYAVGAMTQHAPVDAWIIDDTGFLKQGKHSVGVQRQYTGSAGKITNCQIGTTLTLSNSRAHCPVDMELYLPRCWTDDPERRKEAHIPDEVAFQTKPKQALGMLKRAVLAKLPKGRVLGDTAYGDNTALRSGVRELGLEYALAVSCTTRVYEVDANGVRQDKPVAVKQWAKELDAGAFRRVTWRDGTKQKLWSRFAFRRVVAAADPQKEEVWLAMEWLPGEAGPTKFYLITGDKKLHLRNTVRLFKERYRTERVYEEAKQEMGLDHYEGRRYGGWHHHVSVVLSCYAFVVAERARHFPPCAARTQSAQAAAHAAAA
jgi:SRSO17 transposase